jgi:hypothetical protein
MLATTGKLKKFINLYKDISITVKKITYKILIWIINKLKHGLVLRKIYYKVAGLKLKEINNGSYNKIIFTPNRTAIIR